MTATPPARSRSYVVPCSSTFRDAVAGAAAAAGASPADLARAAFLLAGPDRIGGWPDPGEPAARDRETVVIRSGAAKDRVMRRKPRLQLRLEPGLPISLIRRALALAIAVRGGGAELRVDPAGTGLDARYAAIEEQLVRARDAIDALAPTPLGSIATDADALYMLGLPPGARPNADTVRDRFRRLAKIHHPDAPFGDTARMGLLNAAFRRLRG
ncbi:MAG: J domain-containing protein [Pseudomonadota bacterium]